MQGNTFILEDSRVKNKLMEVSQITDSLVKSWKECNINYDKHINYLAVTWSRTKSGYNPMYDVIQEPIEMLPERTTYSKSAFGKII